MSYGLKKSSDVDLRVGTTLAGAVYAGSTLVWTRQQHVARYTSPGTWRLQAPSWANALWYYIAGAGGGGYVGNGGNGNWGRGGSAGSRITGYIFLNNDSYRYAYLNIGSGGLGGNGSRNYGTAGARTQIGLTDSSTGTYVRSLDFVDGGAGGAANDLGTGSTLANGGGYTNSFSGSTGYRLGSSRGSVAASHTALGGVTGGSGQPGGPGLHGGGGAGGRGGYFNSYTNGGDGGDGFAILVWWGDQTTDHPYL